MKTTIYETITNQIIDAIEQGAGDYRMPWTGGALRMPTNAVTGRAYRGLNILSLWILSAKRGYQSSGWATYQQWQERGAQVRKGEKSATVFFWKDLAAGREDANQPDDDQRPRFVARGYNVFNAEQVDGYERAETPELPESERIDAAESFFAAIPARVTHEAQTPCFVPSFDEVRMVPFSRFKSASAYYGVLAHELTHWSGAEERLNRDLAGRFGSEAYAMEELIAELGAAFIGGRLALDLEPRTDHAPYIAGWLKALKSDSRAIFTAAAKAQAAADYLAAYSNANG